MKYYENMLGKALPIVLIILSVAAFAKAGDKATCSARELKRQDCRLKVGSYEIRLLSTSIARDDGTWHMVDEMPLKGDGVNWERARFDFFKGLPVLQLWLWDAGQGEAKVQALHWYVADARKRELRVMAEGVVRRRRVKPPVEAAKVAPPIYDGEEKHGVKLNKQGKLEWSLGRDKKILVLEVHDGV